LQTIITRFGTGSEPTKQRGDHLCIAADGGSFAEAEACYDQDAGALAERLRHNMGKKPMQFALKLTARKMQNR
jgi:hypothetical protein